MNKKYILALSAVSFLSGCASILGEEVDQKVPFKGGDERHFTFKKVNKSSIENGLVSSFQKASEIDKTRYSDGSTYGVGISAIKEGIKVTHYDNYRSLYNEKSAIYKIAVHDDQQNYSVTISCPSEYLYRTNRQGAMGYEEYIPTDKAIQNFNKICIDANPSIDSSTWIKGEFNLKYKSEDVFSNFTRILSQDKNREKVKGFDIEKAEIFKLPIKKDGKTDLALSVYPYRGGSKVVYAFKYNYKSDAKGNSSYNESEINEAKQKITDIANN